MSLNSDIAKQAHLTEEILAGHIVAVTNDVFQTMIAIEMAPEYPLKDPVTKFHCSITSMVGFAGTYSGVISIHCPVALAKTITSAMLGVTEEDLEDDGDDITDAIGEIANMLGGGIKMVFSKGGLDVKLSVPTVISGEAYTVEILSDVDCVIIPFSVGGHQLLVGLTLKKDE